MKNVLIIIAMLLTSTSIFSQSYKIKGFVTDSIGEPLIGATVVLLTAKDSLLTYFASTDDLGSFYLKSIPKGKYIFQASYTSYKKHEEPLDLTNNTRIINKGNIKLEKISYDLKTVEIQGERVPVQFINDTLIYDALAFDPGKNTTVEDLLKKMPGIEVDDKGDIKAQGKKVNKVTVDGKEFFGNDPKMATQNLPAEAVKKVKVFDKKSEFSETTGIDDGKEEKTIDLELKEDHKNGFFGKITAGYGTDDTYKGSASINKFSPKTRLSLIAKTNNTSKEGFDFNDLAKMSGGFGELFGSDGTFTFNGFPGASGGIFKVLDAGINLNYSPKKSFEINTSYFIKKNNNLVIQDISKLNFIPDFEYKTNNNTKSIGSSFSHNINSILKYKINKNNKIKWNIKFNNNSGENEGKDTLSTFENTTILKSHQIGENDSSNGGINASSYLTFSSNLKKEGRAIFTRLSGNYANIDNTKTVNSLNTYYKDSQEYKIDSIYQKHENLTDNTSFNASIAYTEPLWKMTYLIADMKQEISKNKYNRNLFNRFPLNGNEKNKIDEYDSDFNHSDAKLTFKYNGIKHQLDIGMKYQYSTQKGNYITENKGITRTYKNWLPSINYNYKISRNTNFRARYDAKVKAPSILKLMPIIDNSNPQFVILGNSKLEPELSNDFRISYNSYNSFDGTAIWVSLSGAIVQNTIIDSRKIDELFRTISQPVNSGQSENARLYMNYTLPFKLWSNTFSVGASTSYDHKSAIINDVNNDYHFYDYDLFADIHNYKNKHVTGKIGVEYNRSISKYSVNTKSNNIYNRIKYSANVKWKITKNIRLNNKIKYNTFSNQLSDNTDNEILWNASASFFLKEKRYTIKLSAVDILNQGIGYRQSSGDNYIQYAKTNRIGRYFMLSLTYSLSKFKGPKDRILIITD